MTCEIAIPIFDRFTALDAVGPYEVLQRLPDTNVTFVAERKAEFRTENGFLGIVADRALDDLPNPDVVVFPGGIGTRALIQSDNHPLIHWLRAAHSTSRFTTSVCTGSLVLAKAGLISGLTAATHWSAYDVLQQLGAVPTKQRVVEHLDQRILTAAGVSAGIDMSLRLSELLVDQTAAKAMQLMIEYDPQPPFDAGSVEKAGPDVMRRVQQYQELKD